jgi:hypothetical protein
LKGDDAVGNKQGARLAARREAACHTKADQPATASQTRKFTGRRRSAASVGRDTNDPQPLLGTSLLKAARLARQPRDNAETGMIH